MNPCDLIPATARPALSLDQPPSGPQATGSTQNCVFSTSSTTLPSFGVFVDPTQGVSDAVGSGGNTVGTVVVDGFTATLAAPPGGSACEAFVDVNDGQYVSVQASGLGNLTVDELCSAAQPVVTTVLDALTQLQPS